MLNIPVEQHKFNINHVNQSSIESLSHWSQLWQEQPCGFPVLGQTSTPLRWLRPRPQVRRLHSPTQHILLTRTPLPCPYERRYDPQSPLAAIGILTLVEVWWIERCDSQHAPGGEWRLKKETRVWQVKAAPPRPHMTRKTTTKALIQQHLHFVLVLIHL